MPFVVLFVCTGNVCRSPMAERLLRSRVTSQNSVVCSSAGVSAMSGQPMDPPSGTALRELGGEPHGHVAAQLTMELIADADLVLTAEVSHRATILQLEPSAFRRVFTLLEFGRLGGGLEKRDLRTTTQQLRARVEEVAQQRGVVDAVGRGDDDIADPFGRTISAARIAGRGIAEGVDALIDVLGLPRAAAGAS